MEDAGVILAQKLVGPLMETGLMRGESFCREDENQTLKGLDWNHIFESYCAKDMLKWTLEFLPHHTHIYTKHRPVLALGQVRKDLILICVLDRSCRCYILSSSNCTHMEWSQYVQLCKFSVILHKTKTYPGITENRGYVNQGQSHRGSARLMILGPFPQEPDKRGR